MAPKVDPLNVKQMAAQYGMAYRVIMTQPELRGIFEKAAKQGWDNTHIAAAIQNSKWYANNSESARTAWTAQQMGGADWEVKQQNANTAISQMATQLGAEITPSQLAALSHRYIYEGWDQAGRETFLAQALSQNIETSDNGFLLGMSGNLQEDLAKTAAANGLNLAPSYFESAARSVASGLTTADDWNREVRSQAASLWPTWGDKIMAGSDARDLADGYVNIMAKTFEIDPNDISMSDPYIREAMTQVDEQGNAQAIGLWDFETKLRKDPRWMGTKQATDSISTIATDVLKSFGFMG